MYKCRFALIFLIVLVVYLQQSEGIGLAKKKEIKAAVVATKVGLAKAATAKLKLAALKKWTATKAIIKAPFVLGKKAVLLKIGALKSLAALKAAKAKKIFGSVSKKATPIAAAAAAIPVAAASLPAKPAKPVAASGLPAQTSSSLPSTTQPSSSPAPRPEVIDTYSVPSAQFGSSIVSIYRGPSDRPRTFANGYNVNLFPGGESSSSYQYYPAAPVKSARNEATDTEVTIPHDYRGTPHRIYGVPN